MPRSWGYIIIAVATLVGLGALALPLPELVEIEPIVAPPPRKVSTPVEPQRGANRAKPPVKPKPPPPPPPAKVIPPSNTVGARTLIQPNAKM